MSNTNKIKSKQVERNLSLFNILADEMDISDGLGEENFSKIEDFKYQDNEIPDPNKVVEIVDKNIMSNNQIETVNK